MFSCFEKKKRINGEEKLKKKKIVDSTRSVAGLGFELVKYWI